MSEKYKILSNFVKDMSSETPDVESYLSTKNSINKYELDIDISIHLKYTRDCKPKHRLLYK